TQASLAVEPTDGSVVVMGPGVNHTIANVIVRQIDCLAVASKGKLQHSHTREPEVIPQSFYVRRDHTEVFSNYRHLTQYISKSREELPSRYVYPLSVFGCRVLSGNLPARREPSKVIDAEDINSLERRPQSIYPPAETARAHGIP